MSKLILSRTGEVNTETQRKTIRAHHDMSNRSANPQWATQFPRLGHYIYGIVQKRY